jgi:hypothetical protein
VVMGIGGELRLMGGFNPMSNAASISLPSII